MAGRGPTPADKDLSEAVGVSERAIERWRQAGLLRTLSGRGVPVSYPEDAKATASCITSVLATPHFRCLEAACLVSFLRGHLPTERALRNAYEREYTAFTIMFEDAAKAETKADRNVFTADPVELAKHAARHFSRRSGALGREMRDRLVQEGEGSLPAAIEGVLGVMLGIRDITPADLVLAGFGSLAFAAPTIRAKTGPSTLNAFEGAIEDADWADLILAQSDAVTVYESVRQMLEPLGADLPNTGEDVALDFSLALFGLPVALQLRRDLGDETFDQMRGIVEEGSFADLVIAALGSRSIPEPSTA